MNKARFTSQSELEVAKVYKKISMSRFGGIGPDLKKLAQSFMDIGAFLKQNAENVSPPEMDYSHIIKDGCIKLPSAVSSYFLLGCLVENRWVGCVSGAYHYIKVAGLSTDVDKTTPVMENNLKRLRYETEEEIYQYYHKIDLRSFKFVSDLEKFLEQFQTQRK